MKEYSMSMYASREDLDADKKRDLETTIMECEEIKFRFKFHMVDCENPRLYEMYQSKIEALDLAIDLIKKEISK